MSNLMVHSDRSYREEMVRQAAENTAHDTPSNGELLGTSSIIEV